LEFNVVKRETLKIDRVLNYPNPFTTSTRFWFEHNRPGDELRVTVQVMTITGKIVKTIDRRISTDGNRSDDLEWDGRDDVGARLGRGVYLYRIRVTSSDGQQTEKLEKLLIL
jgi:flagellar hook assembly protein FlgD